jgi:hypothetical protein
MIVDDFHLKRVTVTPVKAHTPLIVDSNTVLTFSISGQLFQAIAGRNPKVFKRVSGIKEQELAKSCSLDGPRELLDSLSEEDALGLLVAKAADHSEEHNAPR